MGLFDQVLENVGKEYQGGKGFSYGTHEVLIMLAEARQKKTKANPETPVIEVTVADETDNDKTAICTLYFHTPGSAKMSVTKVLGLLVHKVGEEKKDAIRELGKKLFASIDDSIQARDIANKLINDKLIGAKGYLVAEPQGNYSTTSYGDLWHYPAEPQNAPANDAQVAAKDVGGAVADVAETELPDFGEDDL